MSLRVPSPVSVVLPKTARIAVVAARFNGRIVDYLLDDCVGRLKQNGIAQNQVEVYRVPGAFELPIAAKSLCWRGGYAAIIALGAVIRGETPHFELVANNCATGLREVGLEFAIPVIFGVLATNTEKQAWARTRGPHSRAGINAADAACEMIDVLGAISRRTKKSVGTGRGR